MRLIKYTGFLLTLLICSVGNAFAQSRNSLVIESDRLVLNIDLKSAPAQLDSILKVAGINAKAPAIKKGEFGPITSDGWQLASKQDEVARFERLLADVNF